MRNATNLAIKIGVFFFLEVTGNADMMKLKNLYTDAHLLCLV